MKYVVAAAAAALALSSSAAFASGEHEPFPFAGPGRTVMVTKPFRGSPAGFKVPDALVEANSTKLFVAPRSSEAGVQTANSLPVGFAEPTGHAPQTELAGDAARRAAAMHLADDKTRAADHHS